MMARDRRARTGLRIRDTDRLPSPVTALTIAMARRHWRNRARAWDREGSLPLKKVVDAVVSSAGEVSGEVIVDLGCGSGQLTLPLARACRHILGIDIDREAIEILIDRAKDHRLDNVQAVVHPLETVELAPASIDLVVSNYALHHLRDADKQRLMERAFVWLRPGGRLVLADMMFGRGETAEDRAIIRQKVAGLMRRGPGGWWRIVKNSGRFLFRIQERPLRPLTWSSMLRATGFEHVAAQHVVAEAYVLTAVKPVAVTTVAEAHSLGLG